MERQGLDRYYADNVGLIHSVARKGFRRLQAIGAITDYDDLVQALAVTFIKSYDLFDESKGAFSTYFVRSAFNKVNRIAEAHEIERLELRIRSVEEMSSWQEDGEMSVEETIAGNEPTPAQHYEAKNVRLGILDALSPVAEMIVEMAIDPPDFIEREFAAQVAHAEFARSNGVEKRSRGSLNVAFVCSVLERTTELSSSILRAAKLEVLSAAERLKND
jgi:RNA polymerase sigma factor (sigma-70 family)